MTPKKPICQIVLIATVFAFICCGVLDVDGQASNKLTPREIAQQTLPSTVLIVVSRSESDETASGSGFFVRENVIVTNFHVVEGASEGIVRVYGEDRTYKILGTVGFDMINDLALLKVDGVKGRPLRLATNAPPAIGDEVFAVGNPKGLEGTFSQGIVSSIRDRSDKKLLQITAPISRGSSGGAVLNDKGEVIGVAVGAIEGGQSLNFVVPVEFVQSLNSQFHPVMPLNGNTGRRGIPIGNSPALKEPVLGATFKNSNDIEFVWLPSGYFNMGSGNYQDDVPVIRVHIQRGFWMGKFEITQGQWEKIMGISLAQQREKATFKVRIVYTGDIGNTCP